MRSLKSFHQQQKSQCVNGTLHVILIGTKEKAPTIDNKGTKNIVAFHIVLLLLVLLKKKKYITTSLFFVLRV